MNAPIRGVVVITMEQIRNQDAPEIPAGASVRVSLGTAKSYELIGDRLRWLAWLLDQAGGIEVIGRDPETIGYVLKELPPAIEMMRTI